MVSQVKLAPTGVDEQAGILLTNAEGEMATVTLSLHAKQPKRGTIAYDKGYIELYEYPRGKRRSSPIRKMAHKKSSKQEKPLKPSSMRSSIWKQLLQARIIILTSITAEMSWIS